MTPRIEPGPHWWEKGALNTAPSLPPPPPPCPIENTKPVHSVIHTFFLIACFSVQFTQRRYWIPGQPSLHAHATLFTECTAAHPYDLLLISRHAGDPWQTAVLVSSRSVSRTLWLSRRIKYITGSFFACSCLGLVLSRTA